MALTKSAGRVSIRVLPDSTRFRSDLKKSLERIERELKAKIRAELFVDRESLAKLKRQIESLVVKIKPTIELNVSLKELEELKTKIESIKPKVNVDLDTKTAAERIAALTRTRTVDIRANVNRTFTDALTGLATRMRALAGLNIAFDSIRAGAEFMDNIDRKAVAFSQTLAKMNGLVGVLGAGLASTFAIGADALNVGKLSLFAPAFVSGLAITIGALVAVLKDMGTVLADMKPRFAALQDNMSAAFWKQAAQPIRDLANKYWPTLNDRLQQTSRNLGWVTKAFTEAISEGMSVQDLDWMFIRLNDAIADIRPAVQALTRTFITLGKFGVNYFPRFVNWVNKLSTQFENFISKAAADGRLDKWMEQGITAAKDLARVTGGVAEILSGIGKAAKNAGAPGLHEFADGMERAADIVGSDRFQKNLQMFFQGTLELTRGITNGIKNLAPSIEAFMPTLVNTLGRFGKIFETAFGFVGKFLENKDFQNGLMTFVTGIENALKNLTPSVGPAASSLGKLLDLMGFVLDVGTRLLNNVFTKLGPEFDKIVDAIKPLVKPVEGVANTVIDSLQQILKKLAEDVLPPLVRGLENAAPALEGLVKKITPGVVKLIENLGGAISFLADSIKNLNDALGPLQEGNDLEWLGDLLFSGGGAGGKFGGSGNPLQDMFSNLFNGINWSTIGADIANGWNEFWRMVVDGWNRMWNGDIFGDQPGKFFRELDDEMNKWWDETIGSFWDDTIGKWIDDTIRTISEAWGKLTSFIDGLFKPGGGVDGFVGGGGGSRSVGGVIGLDNTDTSWFDVLKTTITTGMAGVGEAFTIGGVTAKAAWDLWWGNLWTTLSTTWETIKALVSMKFSEVGGIISGVGTTISGNWNNFWAGIGQVLQGAWGTMTGQTSGGMGNILGEVTGKVASIQADWVAKWASMGATLAARFGEFVATAASRGAGLFSTIVGSLGHIQSTWSTVWATVGQILTNAWSQFQGSASSGVAGVVAVVRQLPGMAASALGNLGGTLASSGASLVAGFASGMRSQLGLVASAAGAIVAAARQFFPNSPAKKGPFSGKGYTPWSGRALVKDFAGGMMDNMSMVRAAAEKVTNAAQIGNLDSFSDFENKVSITKKEVNLTVVNPIAEPTSRTIERTSAAIRISGDI